MLSQHWPVLGLTIIIILALFSRVFVPWAGRPSGALVRRAPLSLLGRLRMHAIPALAGLIFSAAMVALGLAPIEIMAAIPVALLLLIAIPMSYTLTTEGIMAGRTPMRRWTEFGGVTRSRGGVRLQGVAGARGMTVWLSGSRDDDELVLLLRQLVRGAYKGGVGPDLSRAATDGLSATLPAATFDQVRAAGS